MSQSAAILVAALLLSVATAPAVMAGTDTWSRGNEPVEESQVTKAEADRFAEIWTQRFLDEEGLQAYLDRPGLYADGYNDLEQEDQVRLVIHLINHWIENVPGAKDSILTGDEAADQERLDELAMLVFAVVFKKDEFLQRMRADPGDETAQGPVVEAPAGIAEFPDLTQSEIKDHFDTVNAEMMLGPDAPDVPTLDASPNDGGVPSVQPFSFLAGADLQRARDVIGELAPDVHVPAFDGTEATLVVPSRYGTTGAAREDDGPLVPDAPGVPAPHVPTPDVDTRLDVPDVFALLDSVLARLPDVNVQAPEPGAETVTSMMEAGSYNACGQLADGQLVCSPLPMALGVPVPLDLDDDVLTGVAGAEIIVQLSPTVNPDFALGGFAVQVLVKRTVPAAVEPEALPARAFVTYNVPQANAQVLAGFDGTASTLSDTQTAVFTVKDVTLALAGEFHTRLDVTHEAPGATAALVAGFAPLDRSSGVAVPVDPVTAELAFTPVPVEFRADFNYSSTPTSGDRFDVDLYASENTTLAPTVNIVKTETQSLTRVSGVIADVPMELHATALLDGSEVDVQYRAADVIESVAFTMDAWPNGEGTMPHTAVAAVVTDVPAAFDAHYAPPFDVAFTASSRITRATLTMLEEDANGEKAFLGADVQGIPSAFDITGTADPLDVTYEANGNIDQVDVVMRSRDVDSVTRVHVEDIPRSLRMFVDDALVTFTAGDPVGAILVDHRQGGVAAPALVGEHASYRQTAPNVLGAHVFVKGFTSLDVDARLVEDVDLTTVIAGGEPFAFHIQDDVVSLLTYGTLSNLPTRLVLELSEARVHYNAAEPIGKLDFHAVIGNDLTADVEIWDLPSDVVVSWTDTGISYVADQEITRILASATLPTAELAFTVDVRGLARMLDLTFRDNYLAAVASTPIDLVAATVSKSGVAPVTRSGNHATFVNRANGLSASFRVTGFTSFALDDTVTDVSDVNVVIAGNHPFTFLADDATAGVYVNGTVSNVPESVRVRATPSDVLYEAAEPIDRVFAHAEVGDTAADAWVLDVPTSVRVAWTDEDLEYAASAALTEVGAHVHVPGADDLVVNARVKSVPDDFTVTWPDGAASFSTTSAIGEVNVQASVNGGTVFQLVDDHATVTLDGSKIGASVRLSGIKSLSYDARNDATVASVRLSPGGQTFRLYGLLEDTVSGAYVSNLPASVDVDLTPGQNSIGYAASTPIASVWAYVSRPSDGMYAYASATDLPASMDVSWVLDGTPEITYDASGRVTELYAYYREALGGKTFYVSAEDIAPYLRVDLTGSGAIADVRSSASAASASAHVGSLSGGYSNGGAFPFVSGDHAYYLEDGSSQKASFRYSGLKYARVAFSGADVDFEVKNSAARVFRMIADVNPHYASVTIDKVPSHLQITTLGNKYHYDAHGQTINRVSAYYEKGSTTEVSAELLGVPDEVTLDLGLASKYVDYAATQPVTALNVDASHGAWDASLRITGIPWAWRMDFDDALVFNVPSGSIGSVAGSVTNHGAVTTFSGNHVAFDFEEGASGNVLTGTKSTPDKIDASFRMSDVKRVEYKKTTGGASFVKLDLGGGKPFRAWGEADWRNGDRAHANAYLNPLPSTVTLTLGEDVSVSTNANFDLTAYAEAGKKAGIANAPNPYGYHGVSVTDGASGSAEGVKARVFLTGLPTSVTFDASQHDFTFTNWRPKYSYLIAHVDLDDVVTTPVYGYMYVSGLSTTAPTSLSWDMDTAASSSLKKTDWALTTTRGFGYTYANIEYGANEGTLTISNVPSTIRGSLAMSKGTTTFTWDASSSISSIYAGFKAVSSNAYQGYVSLSDLPSDFTLTLGSGGGKGPVFQYNANANTLDVTAGVSASLFGGDLKARGFFSFVNLGKSVATTLSSDNFRITSSPATTRMYADVYADYYYSKSDSGIFDKGGWIEFPWYYRFTLSPDVDRFYVTLTNVNDFNFKWGLVSKVHGSYGTFSAGWDDISVYVNAYGRIQARIDWPWPFGSSTFTLFATGWTGTINVNVKFHRYDSDYASWFGLSWSTCNFKVGTFIQPDPEGAYWNGVTTYGSKTYYVTPNPWGIVPTKVMDLGTAFLTPDSGYLGLGYSYDCGWGVDGSGSWKWKVS